MAISVSGTAQRIKAKDFRSSLDFQWLNLTFFESILFLSACSRHRLACVVAVVSVMATLYPTSCCHWDNNTSTAAFCLYLWLNS